MGGAHRSLGLLRPYSGDASLSAPFLGVIAAIVLYAQIRYFSAAQGAATLPLYWLALMALPPPGRRMTSGAALRVALALTLPVVKGFWPVTIYHRFRSGTQLTDRPEHVQKLDLYRSEIAGRASFQSTSCGGQE